MRWRGTDSGISASAWAEHYVERRGLDLALEFIKASEAHERKRVFRTRTLWVAAPLLLLVAALGVYAVTQGWRAARLAGIALARQLTTQSQLVRTEQVDLEPALLLATDSLLRASDPEGARAVQEAAALLPRTIARLQHPDAVTDVAFSSDGRQVVTAGADNIVRVFDAVGDRKEVSRIARPIEGPRAFSADGRRVASSDGNGGVVIADVATGSAVHHVPLAEGEMLGLSPSGRFLASVSRLGAEIDGVSASSFRNGHRRASRNHPSSRRFSCHRPERQRAGGDRQRLHAWCEPGEPIAPQRPGDREHGARLHIRNRGLTSRPQWSCSIGRVLTGRTLRGHRK